MVRNYGPLFEGELFNAKSVAAAAVNKYGQGLIVLEDHLENVDPCLSADIRLLRQLLTESPPALRFELLSGPHLRSAIDAAFIDAHADLKGVGYKAISTACKLLSSYLERAPSAPQGLGLNVVQVEGDCDLESQAIQRLFDRFMSRNVAKVKAAIVEPADGFVQLADAAADLLISVDRELYEQVVYNGRYVGFIDYAENSVRSGYREIAQSVSSHLVPSTFFVSYHSAKDPETLAEAFLHESLHKKLSNTLYVNNFLIDGEYSGKFNSYWNRDSRWNSNQWECDRAVYAFHFYAHFSNFYHDEKFKDAFKIDGRAKETVAEERGRALFEWMSQTWSFYLTQQGWEFFSELSRRAGYLQ